MSRLDIRRESPTFGRHVAVELSGKNKRQLFIPRGFAHGFAVLSETVIFAYKCDNFYRPDHERGIAFDDPALGINWHVRRINGFYRTRIGTIRGSMRRNYRSSAHENP